MKIYTDEQIAEVVRAISHAEKTLGLCYYDTLADECKNAIAILGAPQPPDDIDNAIHDAALEKAASLIDSNAEEFNNKGRYVAERLPGNLCGLGYAKAIRQLKTQGRE